MTTPVPTAIAIAFSGTNKIASGSVLDVALAAKALLEGNANAPLLVLNYLSSQVIELDLRGNTAQIAERLSAADSAPSSDESLTITASEMPESRGRGRPKLGVMAREVTLLPRHWQWLAEQPGGASVTLRKLVENARHSGASKDLVRAAQESAYRFMSALAGDLANFEEATRALFAPEPARFEKLISAWPADVRAHALMLAGRAFDAASTPSTMETSECAI